MDVTPKINQIIPHSDLKTLLQLVASAISARKTVDADEGYFSSVNSSPNSNSSTNGHEITNTRGNSCAQKWSVYLCQEKFNIWSREGPVRPWKSKTDIEDSRDERSLLDHNRKQLEQQGEGIQSTKDVVESSRPQVVRLGTLSIYDAQKKLYASGNITIHRGNVKGRSLTRLSNPFSCFDLIECIRGILDDFHFQMKETYVRYSIDCFRAGCDLFDKWEYNLASFEEFRPFALVGIVGAMNFELQGCEEQSINNWKREKLNYYVSHLHLQLSELYGDLKKARNAFSTQMDNITQFCNEVLTYAYPYFRGEFQLRDVYTDVLEQFLVKHINLLHIWDEGCDHDCRRLIDKVQKNLLMAVCGAHDKYRFRIQRATQHCVGEIKAKFPELASLNPQSTDIVLKSLQQRCKKAKCSFIESQKVHTKVMEAVCDKHKECKARIFQCMEEKLQNLLVY